MQSHMKELILPSGASMPRFGLGTWGMGEGQDSPEAEAAALRAGLDAGVRLLDTAEMYGDGGSEEVVGQAIAGRRHEVFLVSKVLPSNASAAGTVRACERSLKRMNTERIDLFLLHWRGGYAFEETLAAFERLQREGKIGDWGVSNLDLHDMEELMELPGATGIATNQLLYNLTRRGIEYDLLPRLRAWGIPLMAYSPIEQGRLLNHPALKSVARRRNVTPAQIALAWVLREPDVIAIPKSSSLAHLQENLAAREVLLQPEDLAELDRAFKPPTRAQPLEML
jgi:diketogulonate reductase-like aldo/keto reductase